MARWRVVNQTHQSATDKHGMTQIRIRVFVRGQTNPLLSRDAILSLLHCDVIQANFFSVGTGSFEASVAYPFVSTHPNMLGSTCVNAFVPG